MSRAYFCKIDGDKIGPIQAAQVKKLYLSGQLKPPDTIRREDWKSWKKVGDVESLKSLEAKTPSPAATADPTKNKRDSQESQSFLERASTLGYVAALVGVLGFIFYTLSGSGADEGGKRTEIPDGPAPDYRNDISSFVNAVHFEDDVIYLDYPLPVEPGESLPVKWTAKLKSYEVRGSVTALRFENTDLPGSLYLEFVSDSLTDWPGRQGRTLTFEGNLQNEVHYAWGTPRGGYSKFEVGLPDKFGNYKYYRGANEKYFAVYDVELIEIEGRAVTKVTDEELEDPSDQSEMADEDEEVANSADSEKAKPADWKRYEAFGVSVELPAKPKISENTMSLEFDDMVFQVNKGKLLGRDRISSYTSFMQDRIGDEAKISQITFGGQQGTLLEYPVSAAIKSGLLESKGRVAEQGEDDRTSEVHVAVGKDHYTFRASFYDARQQEWTKRFWESVQFIDENEKIE